MGSIYAAVLMLALPSAGDTRLLDFSATWCGPCQQMVPIVDQLARDGYPVEKVDYDARQDLVKKFRIAHVPTFVLLVNGKEVKRVEGAISRRQLEKLMQKAGITPQALAGARTRGQSPDSLIKDVGSSAKSRDPASQDPFLVSSSNDHAPKGRSNSHANKGRSPSRERSTGEVPSAQPTKQLEEKLIAASVRLRIEDPDGNSVGSGTIIDCREGEALVLTCGHIFRDSKGRGTVLIDTFGPNATSGLDGEVIAYDLQNDIGFVSFYSEHPLQVARIAPRVHALRKSQTVVSVGCDHGAAPTARVSKIVSIDKFLGPPNLQIAGQPVQGRSGGGLFTDTGHVIGICNAADPEDDEGLFAALPAIHAAVDKLGLAEYCLGEDPVSSDSLAFGPKPPQMPLRMPGLRPDTVETTADHRRGESLGRNDDLADVASRENSANAAPVTNHEPGTDASEVRSKLDDTRSLAAAIIDRQIARDATNDNAARPARLTTQEEEALAMLRSNRDRADLIFMIRKRDDSSREEPVVIENASQAFLQAIAGDSTNEASRSSAGDRFREEQGDAYAEESFVNSGSGTRARDESAKGSRSRFPRATIRDSRGENGEAESGDESESPDTSRTARSASSKGPRTLMAGRRR